MSRTNTVEGLKKREKRQKKFLTDLKIRRLRQVNRRGQITGQKKKMSTFKAQSSYDIAKQQSGSKTGMSNLGAGYKESEKKLSDFATKDSAKRNKAKYPKMGTYKGKGKTTDTKTSTTTAKRGKSSIEAKNRARLGDARVDKLKAKNKDFQAMKKGKMTKAQFIKKYPNSQTAKKARK
tara:strand:+ start:290 stop:823 length:534 start_codon:yes stop_codon:yes gene_type:complete